ncbi:predicted protein [Chaetoceros tenuissimus]|uniref:Uncharacterized protein n=1 Tax=Chaetoceros tenuissimus TaxID=426638 RepID=A0AAD3GYT0_9STRA|nr:predicted protein [Chaetoceros tenuissimus]
MRVRQVESDKDYAPSSMETKIKRILTEMHTKYKVPKVTLSDFPASGSFRSMLAEKWQDIRQKNPDFGITKGMSEIVYDDIQIVNKAIKDGKLKPYEDPYHCLLLVVFTLLRIFAYRPNEVKKFNAENMTFGKYIDGELKGETYMQCQVWFDKVTKLKLGKTQLDRTYGTAKVYDNSKDEDFYFKPVELFLFYNSRRPKRKTGNDEFLCHATRKKNGFNKDTDPWFRDANVGENWISSVYRRIGDIIGNEEFKKVTGHGGRASFITHALLDKVNPQAIIAQTRHASFNALQNYARNVDQGASQLQLSLFADKKISASGTSSTKVSSSANAATMKQQLDSKPSSAQLSSSANAATKETDLDSKPSSTKVYSSANAATRETDLDSKPSSVTLYSSANAATKPDYSSPKRKKPMSTTEELTPKTKAIRKLEEKLDTIEKENELKKKKQTKLKLQRLKKEKEKLQLENNMLKRTQQTQQPPPPLHYQHSPYFHHPSMPYHQVHPPHLHHPPPPPPQYYYHQPDERRKNNPFSCTIS